jgi:ferric-dicitrate binding protein FerR (iron transport regulator)
MNEWLDELQALCEAAIEGRLTPEQAARLERLVLDEPEARRFYAAYVQQHARLHWSGPEPASAAPRTRVNPSSGGIPPAVPASPLGSRRRWRRAAGWLSAAAVLALIVWLGLPPRDGRATPYVATLADSKACKWGGGTLPTEPGARLPAGRLRLAEGLARVAFADGAEVTIEAPADLELVSPRRCVLHAGRLVAKVSPEAIGFTVDTPTAVIEDLGTEFGVNVRRGRSADVQVFSGKVDVRHRGSGRVEHMRTGESLSFAPGDVAEFDPLAEEATLERSSRWADDGATRLIQVSTATGRGKDAYIRAPTPKQEGPDALLLVKNTVPELNCRKAYIGLDLAPASGLRAVEAQLSFAFAPTGMGYASEVPDATFAVYGLADEALDGWDEKTIRWDNAPANRPGGAALDLDKVVLVGRFEIVQGVLTGTREVSGPALVEFLNRDTNGLATFILVRETVGSGRHDLVHGFAGKHHPDLPPPTLKLTAVPPRVR